jgi:signal transduction histidine kinase
MASLGRLAAGVAHELKNPLNFVTNFAEVTLELLGELRRASAAGDESAIAELLADVESNSRKVLEHGQRANVIVEQMMDHARSSPSKSTPRQSVDVNALVREQVAMEMEGRRTGRPEWTCQVVEDLGAETGAVTASSQEIARVVQSLLRNALDALDERAASETGPYEPVLRVQTRREGGAVSVAVSDNGSGLAAPLRQRVFEPFYTTRPPGSGHPGLGLSLAHETVVGGYGGQIEVESEEGVGSTFTARLPAG